MTTYDPQALALLPAPQTDVAATPQLAFARRARGVGTVCVLDVPQADGSRLHWLDSEHARGWLEPGTDAPLDPQAFERVFAAATQAGFVGADAAILASIPGAEIPDAADAPAGALPADAMLPRLSWSDTPRFASSVIRVGRPLGLYGLVDSATRLREALAAGLHTVQLRLKTPPSPDPAWHARLREQVAQCIQLAREAEAELFINDHWRLAAELGASGVHLGQEDLQALGEAGRAQLLDSGVALGVSSHSLWELCRARALSPRYIACGPVWPTTTKDMPWRPQGMDNLGFWVRRAGCPVVAIGGILEPAQAQQAARAGADGVCVVRGLGETPQAVVPAFQAAIAVGRAAFRRDATFTGWPHPSLPTHLA